MKIARWSLAIPALLLFLGGCAEGTKPAKDNHAGAAEPAKKDEAKADAHAADDHEHEAVKKAVCVLVPVGMNEVAGTIYFEQGEDGVKVHGIVSGLTPGKHGFHIHEFGDITSVDGMSAGGHFNPHGDPHGARDADHRHAGDLGNLEADDKGEAVIDFSDTVLELNGPHSIIGRGVVVHEKEDDYGQPVGNAGARIAVGVIGIQKPE